MRERLKVVCVLLALVLLASSCNRTGLSRQFRKEAEQVVEALHAAEQSWSEASVQQADAAVSQAKLKTKTSNDVKLSEVLDWYAILLRRRDLKRTENWRRVCDAEIRLFLKGKEAGTAETWTGYRYEPTPVKRGDCQESAFQMMAQDCNQLVSSRNIKAADCAPIQTTK